MAAAHSKPLSACTLVRPFDGSAMTAMTSGVSRSFASTLDPSGRKIGSQYAESSFDSRASCCSSRFTEVLFTQMNRVGCRFAGAGALLPASRTSLTSASGTSQGWKLRTARSERIKLPTDGPDVFSGGGAPRAPLTSRLNDHLQRAIDAFVERSQRLREVRELEVVRDQLSCCDPTVGHERDDLLHCVAIRAHAVQIELLEDDLLEVDEGRLFRNAGERDAPALADHADRLADGVLRPGRVDGHVGAEPAGHFADARHRIVRAVVDRLEAELARALEPAAAADDEHPGGAQRFRAHRDEHAHAARAYRGDGVTRVDPRPLHRVQRDRGGVAEPGDVERQR